VPTAGLLHLLPRAMRAASLSVIMSIMIRLRFPPRFDAGTAFALLIAIAMGSPACSTNPVTGERQLILMSTQDEKAIDEQAARQVEEQMGLVEDPELNRYLNEVGQALAAHSPRQDVRYRFHIVAMDEPNAFALPGGDIYVSRGLLNIANSEAELANVLGHEIGHVAARHAAQRDTVQKAVSVLTVIGVVGAAVGGAQPNGNGGPIGNPGLFAYSRDQEAEADAIGQDLAVMAGVDPMGMASFLRSLDAATRLEQGYSRGTGYFDTHPATRQRAAEAATSAQVRRWKKGPAIAKTREEFLAKLDELPIGQPASEGVVKDDHFMHPDLRISLRFPPGWEIQNLHSAVVGVAPGRGAVMMLELQGEGDDPRAAAMGFSERESLRLVGGQSLRLNGFEAYRATGSIPTPGGPSDAEITWIAYDGMIYRLSAFATGSSSRRYAGVFRSFARGFKKLDDAALEEISDLRLRVVEARAGETLAEFGERTHNTWSVAETAVANALRSDQRLRSGQLVKVAVREPYRSHARVQSPVLGVAADANKTGARDGATAPSP